MDCKQAHEQLYRGERSIKLWVHCAFCGRCRAEARALRHLERAISTAPRPEPPAKLLANLLAIAQQEPASQASPAPLLWPKASSRLAFWLVWAILAALLALSFAVAYVVTRPKPASKPVEPPASMIDIAPEPGDGSSVRLIGHYPNGDSQEGWAIPRASYFREITAAGKLRVVGGMEADTKRCWIYEPGKGVCYVADFGPIADGVDEFLERNYQSFFHPEKIYRMAPYLETARFEYSATIPPEVKEFQFPEATKMLQANIRMEKMRWGGGTWFVIFLDYEGKEICNYTAPLDASKLR